MNYDFRVFTQNIGTPSGTIVKAFGENARRVALHVYASNNAFISTVYTLNNKNANTNYWGGGVIPSFITYPYRDFGPIIQGEIWLGCFDVTAVWVLTEVYRTN